MRNIFRRVNEAVFNLKGNVIIVTDVKTVKLNDGVEIPVFGLGTFQIPADGSTYKAVREALDLGIRHIDTAAAYFNERETGKAIRESGIPREQVFLTSKLWLQDYGYEAEMNLLRRTIAENES